MKASKSFRRREDSRPFYLYNHYYSPPDVLAVADPVAVSPLARAPDDPRVVGYFQIDPDGTVRTPYTPEPDAEQPPRGARVLMALRSDDLARLRALARGDAGSGLVPAVPSGQPNDEAGALATGEEPPRARPPRPRPVRDEASPEGRGEGNVPAALQGNTNQALAPSGPLTVSLNPWAQSVYEDLNAAQGGDELANLRVQQRGRSVPLTRRNVVSWDEIQGNPEPPDGAHGGTEPRRQQRPQVRHPAND